LVKGISGSTGFGVSQMLHKKRNQYGPAGPDVALLRRCCGR